MTTTPTTMTVVDYCAALERNEIVVNRSYQRSDKVWPQSARSFLIESILLGFPVPKFYLHFTYDIKGRRVVKEIVDGQQRTFAILGFHKDEFQLSGSIETEELRGLRFTDLPEEWHARFVSYQLSFDQFVNVTPEYVRQTFRRMNSYTVPLNPEELRHAERQGAFKWFISRIADRHSDRLLDLGVLPAKAIARMQDLKLYTEISHAIMSGIKTTSKRDLDWIYRHLDEAFPQKEWVEPVLERSLALISTLDYLKGTPVTRPYQIYSLTIALCHAQHPVSGLSSFDPVSALPSASALQEPLLDLADALESGPDGLEAARFGLFISASSEKTNVKREREVRTSFYIDAIRAAASK